MLKGVEFTPLPLDVEGPFEESFGFFAPLESENWMDRPNGKSDTPFFVGKFEWDGVPLPFEMDLEMDTEFFRSECSEPSKEVELTLAELNDERPMSPLINPEMERLHRIATRAERDSAGPSATFTSSRKDVPFITLEFSEQNVKKEASASCSGQEETNEGGTSGDSEGASRRLNKKPPATWTITQSPTENSSPSFYENCSAKQPIKREEALRNYTEERPSRLAQEVQNEFHGAKAATNNVRDMSCVVVKNEREHEWNGEPVSADEQEESADEEIMDSDDDFEVESLSPGSKNRKGRRGECDDLSPNPQKLLEISKELERLNKVISDLKPIHQLPVNARTRSRKEKNKLASRACRLKKKAQYEANKLKLHGLEVERGRLLHLIESVKKEIVSSAHSEMPREGLSKRVEQMMQSALMGNEMVAGRTTEFVESTLKATARANPWMGIQEVHLNI